MVVEILILIAIAILGGVSLKTLSEIKGGIDRLILINEEFLLLLLKRMSGQYRIEDVDGDERQQSNPSVRYRHVGLIAHGTSP